MTKNFARRKVARTNALFQARNAATTAKQPLTLKEFVELVNYIRRNQNGKFGIEALMNLSLNTRIQNYPDDEFLENKSLLELAVFYKRDAISSLLMRAGASPIPPYILNNVNDATSSLIAQVNNFLWSANSCFSPYVVKIALNVRKPSAECMICTSIIEGIQLYPCKHVVCDFCFWKKAVLSRDAVSHDIQCPLSDCRCFLAVDEKDVALYPIALDDEDATFQYPPDIIRMKSKAKFDMLPEKFDPTTQPKNKKKMPFAALPMRAISSLNLGESKSGRIENLFKAVEKSDIARVKALIAVGVDLDAVNEYGQTSFFISCWKEDSKMQKLLIGSGANSLIPDNAGYLPINFSEASTFSGNGSFAFLSRNDYESSKTVKQLVDPLKYPIHPGSQFGGSFLLEGFISEAFLVYLDDLIGRLPIAITERSRKASSDCADRLYFCDSFGVVQKYLSEVISMAGLGSSFFFQQMRFLKYEMNGFVPPHVDLARTSPEGIRSTHTFILYTRSCGNGGDTVLLEHIPTTSKPNRVEIARIAPRRSTLLLFPHMAPHEGLPAGEAKVLLRGEMVFSP